MIHLYLILDRAEHVSTCAIYDYHVNVFSKGFTEQQDSAQCRTVQHFFGFDTDTTYLTTIKLQHLAMPALIQGVGIDTRAVISW